MRTLPLLLVAFLIARGAAAATHVIQISLDGARGDLIAAAVATGALPNFRRFVDEGAVTWNARTDYTNTTTLPNHTCMLTGRPVDRLDGSPLAHHGYTANSDPRPHATLHNSGNKRVRYKASTFDVVHDAGLSTGFYATKTKFSLYDRSFPDQIDRYVSMSWDSTSAPMQANFLYEMAAHGYNYCFLHYHDLDTAGHDHGWGSPAWQEALRRVDHYLGDLFALVEGTPALRGTTAIIVTADHGGSDKTHARPGAPVDYTIPVLAWGAGVARGADLYALNRTTRRDPGPGRPDYAAPLQPIRNGDTGNLALHLLGLGPIPGSTINAKQDLAVDW